MGKKVEGLKPRRFKPRNVVLLLATIACVIGIFAALAIYAGPDSRIYEIWLGTLASFGIMTAFSGPILTVFAVLAIPAIIYIVYHNLQK
ncbi:MAG: hypothetical protein HYW48_06890 [Deltaproteobacteria bacterium]|nr:hypothetical protein [Deltaproteobacteria bacterium]